MGELVAIFPMTGARRLVLPQGPLSCKELLAVYTLDSDAVDDVAELALSGAGWCHISSLGHLFDLVDQLVSAKQLLADLCWLRHKSDKGPKHVEPKTSAADA